MLVQNKQGVWHRYPTTDGRTIVQFFNIGGPGLLLPLDVWVHDPIGLANPTAAHSTPYPERRIGHNKYAGSVWDIAELSNETSSELTRYGDVVGTSIDAIRGIFACSPDREMLESVRAPLTPDRVWQNLIHAVGRSSLRYDHDPRQAYRCN